MKTKQWFYIDRPTVEAYLTSSNDYVAVPFTKEGSSETRTYWDTWHLAGIKILRFSAATKDLKVQILGSVDGSTFTETIEAEFSVTTTTPVLKRIPAYWPAIQVQVKPSTSSQHGTLTIKALGTTISSEVDTELTITGTDLATGAKQDTQKTAIDAVKTAVDAVTTKLISAPATEASLSSIDGKLAKGDQLKAASLSVTPGTDIPAGRPIGKVTLDGPTAPIPVAISFASADAQTIIAAPSAGSRIRITKLWLSCSANFIIQLISGSTTIGNLYGMGLDMDFVQPLKLNEAEAFKLDSNIATQTYGGVCYYVEAV